MNFIEPLFKFIKTHNLPIGESNVSLLAVSGGMDSMCMAQLFLQAKLPFAIAHCNFQLRGTQSDEEEVFVRQFAEKVGVAFYSKRFDTRIFAENEGVSTQMAARNLRYAWFVDLCEQHGFSAICTAHHLNDSVESALINFTRGASLPGLSGIPVQNWLSNVHGEPSVPVVRPLLFADLLEMKDFAKNNDVEWRLDSSNETDVYARNFIRHQLIPKLSQINPNFIQTAARNMRRIRAADDNLTYFLQQIIRQDPTGVSLDKVALAQLPSPRQAIRQLLKPYGFDAEQTRQLAENLHQVGLQITAKTGFNAQIERTRIWVFMPEKALKQHSPIAIHADDLMLRLPDSSRIMLMYADKSAIIPEKNSDIALIAADSLKFPLHLRHWQAGDAFQPLGMQGKSQKLQDFFTNQKLSRPEKERVWLLENGDKSLIWVLGFRQDERYKIQSETIKTLKINWIR